MGRESRRKAEQRARSEARRKLAELQADPSRIVQSVRLERIRIGPLPSPDDLAAYAQVDPALVERIVGWAEEEARHRRALERLAADEGIAGARDRRSVTRASQRFGFTLGVLAIGAGVVVVHLAESSAGDIGGSVLSVVALAGLVWGPRAVPPPTPLDDEE